MNKNKKAFGIFTASNIMLTFTTLFILGVFSMVISSWNPLRKTTAEYELINLIDTERTQGDFFLGTGGVKNNMYYYFYVKSSDGSIKGYRVKMGKVIFKYISNGQKPKATAKIYSDEAIDSSNPFPDGEYVKEWKLSIPPASIKHDFILDNK